MNERETTTFETPVGKIPVTINTFMTGGEMMDLEGISVGAGIKSVDGRSGEISMNAESAYSKRLRKLVDIMIVSIGEVKEINEKWSALRNLHGRDYAFVMKAVEASAAGITTDEGKA